MYKHSKHRNKRDGPDTAYTRLCTLDTLTLDTVFMCISLCQSETRAYSRDCPGRVARKTYYHSYYHTTIWYTTPRTTPGRDTVVISTPFTVVQMPFPHAPSLARHFSRRRRFPPRRRSPPGSGSGSGSDLRVRVRVRVGLGSGLGSALVVSNK